MLRILGPLMGALLNRLIDALYILNEKKTYSHKNHFKIIYSNMRFLIVLD